MTQTPPYQITDPATGEVTETFPYATDAEVEGALAELSWHARRRPDPKLAPHYAAILAKASPTRTWRGASVKIYRNWLRHIAEARRPARLSGVAMRGFERTSA